ncbi:DUF2497 domain-containing protein [Acidocella sp.]|uniref:DUF2497 domain-containing protein n=1 Tax=Acidocella sp. TaxID=50710 RepID=UPI002611566D|nr:DUF2497 domain-containing protein [Acidocella sp.]MDD2795299.1 DUF2497 domain-containing protein [Acidocella sp.]
MSENGSDFNNPAAGEGAEPSMEEIQASIRRILLEEEENQNQNALEEDQDEDVLQLDSSMLAAEHPAGREGERNTYQPSAAGQNIVRLQETGKEDLMEDNVQIPKGLVGDEASSSIANTIGSLVQSISTERAVAVSRGGITIEDLVREEIKPVLKAWLDTQLPSLVERVVRAEIKRVIDRT